MIERLSSQQFEYLLIESNKKIENIQLQTDSEISTYYIQPDN